MIVQESAPYAFAQRMLQTLNEARKIEIEGAEYCSPDRFHDTFSGAAQLLSSICTALGSQGKAADEKVMRHVLDLSTSDTELGGLGLSGKTWEATDADTLKEIGFLTDAWLAAADSQASARRLPAPVHRRSPETRRPMNLAEKILAHHAFSVPRAEGVEAGDLLRVSVDWVIASELSWVGMRHSMTSLGMKPTAWRNDRFWLAGDHAVDPRTYKEERVQGLIKLLESAKQDLKMTENQGSNYTILHTEFVRERAEPGMLVLGSDSHTCSAGAVSSLAIGLGAGDVMAGLATGETWFKVPESIRINFTGEPAWYIRGKDVILSILKQLKRNTYAAERIVEFGGPGAKFLSCDARFAISNMCTELGAISGIFEPDTITQAFINGRKRRMYKSESIYFQPDKGASYAATFEINLSEVESFVAIYPSPDQVCPVKERLGMKFDGCFIGACTTTEEDLILAALVLEAGLHRGLTPAKYGKRVVVPGSLPIVRNLRNLGLLDIYSKCGYEQPAPGCSLCLGIGADVAEAGSHWLSSQNRNFKNRMGRGAVGNICSAATVAASSFSMALTDPRDLLKDVSETKYNDYLNRCKSWRNGSIDRTGAQVEDQNGEVNYVEPCLLIGPTAASNDNAAFLDGVERNGPDRSLQDIKGNIYKLGDYVDTDAIIPAPACVDNPTDEMLGSHCFEVTNPDFRNHVKTGYTVVVGGKAFGCGSSREEAPRALKGIGVECVIARSFAFIFARNMPNIGMLAITITDEAFYEVAEHGEEVKIDVQSRSVHIGEKEFPFCLDDMELKLIRNRGLASSYQKFGNEVFEALCRKDAPIPAAVLAEVTLQSKKNGTRDMMDW